MIKFDQLGNSAIASELIALVIRRGERFSHDACHIRAYRFVIEIKFVGALVVDRRIKIKDM